MTDEQARELITALHRIGDQLERIGDRMPDSEDFPLSELVQLLENMSRPLGTNSTPDARILRVDNGYD